MTSRFAARTGLALLGLAEVAAAAPALLPLLPPGAPGRHRRPLSVPGEPPAALPATVEPAMEPANIRQSGAPAPAGSRSAPAGAVDARTCPNPAPAGHGPDAQHHGVRRLARRLAGLWPGGSLRRHARDRHRAQAASNTGLIRVETRGESYDWLSRGARPAKCREAGFRGDDARGRGPPRHPRSDPAAAGASPAGQKQDQAKQTQASPAAQAAAQQQPRRLPLLAGAGEAGRRRGAAAAAGRGAGPASTVRRRPKGHRRNGGARIPLGEVGRLYARRVDEMIGVLKRRACRYSGSACRRSRSRATSEVVYLNDLYRGRAEKAGITYIDIWDGFVDESDNLQQLRPRLRRPDAPPACRRRRTSPAPARASSRPLRRTRDPPHDGERDAGRNAAATGGARHQGAADGRRTGTSAAPRRKPDHVTDRAEGRGRHLARRNAGASDRGGFGCHARAGEGRANGGPGRTSRRFRLAAPRHRHRDRRAAARSGRAARAHCGGAWHIGACRRRSRAEASAPRERREPSSRRPPPAAGLNRPAAALRNTAAAAAARFLRGLVRRRALVAFSSPAAHRR